jgi:hypothetical protein
MYCIKLKESLGKTYNEVIILYEKYFDVKYFMKNIFGIFRYLIGEKIMVNENHFQFDRKNFFNF